MGTIVANGWFVDMLHVIRPSISHLQPHRPFLRPLGRAPLDVSLCIKNGRCSIQFRVTIGICFISICRQKSWTSIKEHSYKYKTSSIHYYEIS